MSWPLFQVDAFAAAPFAGNPAAVCLLEGDEDAGWMQAVAAEMNLSETAFLRPAGTGRYGLRWFTPTVEVELCGHATLASAHVLWSEGRVGAGTPIRFDTASGPLAARPRRGHLALVPATPPRFRPAARPAGHPGAAPSGFLALAFDTWCTGRRTAVRLLPPTSPPGGSAPAGIVTAAADPGGAGRVRVGSGGYDFVSRYFAPAAGIDEDPVTGSAHCTLGPFWAERLGRDELTGYQASRRGGLVQVRPKGDRVLLGGQAVTVVRGRLV